MEESSISSKDRVHGYGDHYIYTGDYMEGYQMSEYFWNSLTKEESKATSHYEEVDVEAGIDAYFRSDCKKMIVHEEGEIEDGIVDNDSDDDDDNDEVESYADTRFHIEEFEDMTVVYSHDGEHNDCPENHDDYEEKFEKATRKGEWDVMEKIGKAHPETLSMKRFHNDGTALHHTLWYGEDRVVIAVSLMNLMTSKDLETLDSHGYTPLALAVFLHHGNDLLRCMIERNMDLLKIGKSDRIPIIVSSWKGFKDTTEFLYPITPWEILSPEYKNLHDLGSDQDLIRGRVGINLLNQCISLNLFGIAENLLESSPVFLRREDDSGMYPTHALAKAMTVLQISNTRHKKSRDRTPSPNNQESICICDAYKLLQLIIRVKDFEIDIDNSEYIVDAMMEAAKHGIIEFITEILNVDRELISINKDDKNMFWHAIMNRQEKVFNLIYAFDKKKDMLLSFNLDDKGNPAEEGSTKRTPNILHFVAELPPSLELDRISGPDLQMQREVQWFKAVQDVTKTPTERIETNRA